MPCGTLPAVAWSYDLLDDEERRLFSRTSVFAGAFDLAAVEAVCSGEELARARVFDVLTRLVDKSLVVVAQVAGGTRYRLLETLRDFARNRLSESDDVPAIRAAHLRWAVGFAENAGRQMMGPGQVRWLEEIAATMDDLRAALAWAIEVDDPETGLQIMVGLPVWFQVRTVRDARYWLESLLRDESLISRPMLGRGLSQLGVVLGIHGESRSVEVQERALRILRDVGDAANGAWALHYLGIGRWDRARPEVARDLTLEALAAFTETGEMVGTLRCLWWLILWELEFGTVAGAMAHGAQLKELVPMVPGPIAGAHATEAFGLLARVNGDMANARDLFRQAIGLHAQVGNAACLSHCLEHVALVALDGGDPERAAVVLGTVDAIRDDVVGNSAVPPFERIWHDQATRDVRAALGEAAFVEAWGRGRAMRLDEAIASGVAAIGS
jgi:non-specific serine/threonine protein kinase